MEPFPRSRRDIAPHLSQMWPGASDPRRQGPAGPKGHRYEFDEFDDSHRRLVPAKIFARRLGRYGLAEAVGRPAPPELAELALRLQATLPPVNPPERAPLVAGTTPLQADRW